MQIYSEIPQEVSKVMENILISKLYYLHITLLDLTEAFKYTERITKNVKAFYLFSIARSFVWEIKLKKLKAIYRS